MSILTPDQAVAMIQAKIHARTNIGLGMCQANAHEIYGIGSGAASAYIAWLNAQFKHHDLGTAPIGAFIYMDGGHTVVQGHPAGHVVINAGGGKVYTPGGPQDQDHWYLTTLAEIRAGWPWHHYVGWSEDNNGVRVPGLEPVGKAHKKVGPTPHVDAAVVATEKAIEKNQGAEKKALKGVLAVLKKFSTKF